MNEQVRIKVLGLGLPKGTPLREVLRITMGLGRFARTLRRATPEERDRIFAYLAEQPGVTITRSKTDQAGSE